MTRYTTRKRSGHQRAAGTATRSIGNATRRLPSWGPLRSWFRSSSILPSWRSALCILFDQYRPSCGAKTSPHLQRVRILTNSRIAGTPRISRQVEPSIISRPCVRGCHGLLCAAPLVVFVDGDWRVMDPCQSEWGDRLRAYQLFKKPQRVGTESHGISLVQRPRGCFNLGLLLTRITSQKSSNLGFGVSPCLLPFRASV